jgi:secreted PhoX family phosphatase
MVVTSTSEDLVLRIELHGDRAFVSNYVKNGVNVTGLDNPDNLALDRDGTLYIQEDNGPADIWAVPNTGKEHEASQVLLFASLADCSAESTGLYFSHNGKTAWLHIQHAGGVLRNDLLIEFTRPKK